MTIQTAQITVTTTPTMLFDLLSRTGGGSLMQMQTGTDIYIGDINVTTATGYLIPGVKGQSHSIQFNEATYGITASGTAKIAVIEVVSP